MTAPARMGPAPDAASTGLVLLHGRGGSAADILGLARALEVAGLAAVAPEAAGNSWWPVSFLAAHDTLAPHLDAGLAAVEGAVAQLEAEGLARSRIAVAGFSQGGCLALEYAARSGGGLLGAAGLSSGLVGTGDTGDAAEEALYGHAPKAFDYAPLAPPFPVLITCHERDPHIPLRRVRETEEAFTAMGADVRSLIHPGAGHGVLADDVAALRALLAG
ncbi:phospholipase [Rhodobacteraceae bacterium WD3A24]|nr:phospholipase [Rhodobacteraceae bacterium WD3A24]